MLNLCVVQSKMLRNTGIWKKILNQNCLKILHPNPKGNVALESFWGYCLSTKITFLIWHETSSKHHWGWQKVLRITLWILSHSKIAILSIPPLIVGPDPLKYLLFDRKSFVKVKN